MIQTVIEVGFADLEHILRSSCDMPEWHVQGFISREGVVQAVLSREAHLAYVRLSQRDFRDWGKAHMKGRFRVSVVEQTEKVLTRESELLLTIHLSSVRWMRRR